MYQIKPNNKYEKKHFIHYILPAGCNTFAEDINTLPKDTTKVIDIEEVVVIASPKETGKLRELPTAVSLLSQKDMQANQITTLKEREFTGTQFLLCPTMVQDSPQPFTSGESDRVSILLR